MNSSETGSDRRKSLIDNPEHNEFSYISAHTYVPNSTVEDFADVVCEEKYVTNSKGNLFYTQCWHKSSWNLYKKDQNAISSGKNPKGVIFFIHGFGGTIKYNNELLLRCLCFKDYIVYGMDGYGHGFSEGLHAHIKCFSEYTQHYLEIYSKFAQKHKSLKKFLLSVSMGGAVTNLLLNIDKEKIFDGSIFISPMIEISPEMIPNSFVVRALQFVAKYLPTYKLTFTKDLTSSCYNDPKLTEIVMKYPLFYNERARLNTAKELLFQSLNAHKYFKNINCPVLVLHGEKDVVTSSSGSEKFINQISSVDKRIIIYQGEKHGLLLEKKAKKVFDDVVQWIDERI